MIAGFRIEWDTGDDTLDRLSVALERAGNELAEFGKYVFPRMVPVFEGEMEKQFDAQGAGESGGWAPLSEQYARWKEQNYPGQPILQREGRLHEALTQSGSPFARRVFGSDTFDFGTLGVEYASYHQLGTARMPARRLFDFGSDFERLLLQEGEAAAREAIAAVGADEFLSEGPP